MSDFGERTGGGAEPGGGHAAPGEATQEIYIFTRDAAREVDRLATGQYGMPSILLMENAAFHLADVALHMLEDAEGSDEEDGAPRVMIFCGPGNNGGDGLALARHLHNSGVTVEILLAAPVKDYKGDAATNLQIAMKMDLPILRLAEEQAAGATAGRRVDRFGPPDLVVDALLGTGLGGGGGGVREPIAGLIAWINDMGRKGAAVLAVDIPSGLDCDTGEPVGSGAAVQADVTVTLVGLKKGFTSLTAQGYIGEVVVADIGAPRELAEHLGTPMENHELPDRPEDARHEPRAEPPPRKGRPEL